MSEALPAGLRPPVKLALAKAVDTVPSPGALPGRCLYELKWDGFRIAILNAAGTVSFWSRQGKDLSRYFPDLKAAAVEQVPAGFVVDGEAAIWTDGRLNFGALQRRLTSSPRTLPPLVRDHPASFVAFDLLAVSRHDTRSVALRNRRALLEELTSGWDPPLSPERSGNVVR
jgi:ATP-dependent DNA ligase